MQLFEAIIDANHRAVAGDASAGLHPAEFAAALPVIALTCVDPRLNAFFPNALALPAEQFIWLRNAGNLITGTLSSTMRSLALACAVKGGREIAIIGHTDCLICRTTALALLEKFKALGIERSQLPENVMEFFGMFGSERQNVIKACDYVRSSPLIAPKIPVHGLLLDLETGKLEWLVNGYQTLASPSMPTIAKLDFTALGTAGAYKNFELGEMKFPAMKIGEQPEGAHTMQSVSTDEIGSKAQKELPRAAAAEAPPTIASKVAAFAEQNWPAPPIRVQPAPLPPLKKKNPLPPPIRPRADLRRG